MIFMRAVGKIQARDVHAEAKQVAHGGFGMASGADGGDDFGATANPRRDRRRRQSSIGIRAELERFQ
jgi:hypothetical protein